MNASETHPSTKDIFRFGLRSIWFVAQLLKESLSSLLDQIPVYFGRWKENVQVVKGVAQLTISDTPEAITCAKGQWLVIKVDEAWDTCVLFHWQNETK